MIPLKLNNMIRTEIAKHFSSGEFEIIYDFLAENAVWRIIEENDFIGKQAIINNCIQVDKYFESVTTNFEIHHIISDENKVAVSGIAEFLKDSQRVSFVSACDLYEFDDNNRILKITSYCIRAK